MATQQHVMTIPWCVDLGIFSMVTQTLIKKGKGSLIGLLTIIKNRTNTNIRSKNTIKTQIKEEYPTPTFLIDSHSRSIEAYLQCKHDEGDIDTSDTPLGALIVKSNNNPVL
jgi:hypothetical protein